MSHSPWERGFEFGCGCTAPAFVDLIGTLQAQVAASAATFPRRRAPIAEETWRLVDDGTPPRPVLRSTVGPTFAGSHRP